jgi:hypothetical protein
MTGEDGRESDTIPLLAILRFALNDEVVLPASPRSALNDEGGGALPLVLVLLPVLRVKTPDMRMGSPKTNGISSPREFSKRKPNDGER